MTPLAKNLASFEKSGDKIEAAHKIELAYMFFTLGNENAEESISLLDRHNLCMGDLKFRSRNLTKAFDAFHRETNILTKAADAEEDFTRDYEALSEIVVAFQSNSPLWEEICRLHNEAKKNLDNKEQEGAAHE